MLKYSIMGLIPTFYTDCVVAIGVANEKGEASWVASGFLYGKKIKNTPNNYRVFLVTNKHVLEGKKLIYVRVNPAANDKEAFGYELPLIDTNQKHLWSGHSDKNVDVAVISINYKKLVDDAMQVSFFADDNHTYNVSDMKKEEFTEGDFCYALGFPMGLVGKKRNTVIVRAGVISRIRDSLDQPKNPFLVDSVVFPGNSGGPLVNKPELVAIEGTKSTTHGKLIGVVASYIPYLDVADSRQTGRPRAVFEENSGLTNVFTVNTIDSSIKNYERERKKLPKSEPKKSETASENSDTNMRLVE
jgi:S1-C subfamily serine protease